MLSVWDITERLRVPAVLLKITLCVCVRADQESECVGKGAVQQGDRCSGMSSSGLQREQLDVVDDPDNEDSFFDDPLPKPDKTYGW